MVGLVVLVLVLAGVAVALERGVHRWWGRGLPTGDAAWIWAALPLSYTEPVAFWAVRDFRVGELPERAELAILADEEYVVHLNGRRVGSNRYAPGAPVDRYRVEGLLVPGGNRLAVELRSGRGSGGLLARLDLGGGRRAVVTDETWRILRRHHPGLLRGWLPVGPPGDDGVEAPYLWGRPPVGRWGRPEGVRDLAAAPGNVAVCAPRAAVARQSPGALRQVFDWGADVYGYLTLHLDPERVAEPAVGLLLVGAEPRRPLRDPETALPVVPLPGLPTWTDTVPRRFRYAAVTGLPTIVAAEVLPADPAAAASLPSPAAAEPIPLLGLDTPLHLTPAERAVRRQIDGVDEP